MPDANPPNGKHTLHDDQGQKYVIECLDKRLMKPEIKVAIASMIVSAFIAFAALYFTYENLKIYENATHIENRAFVVRRNNWQPPTGIGGRDSALVVRPVLTNAGHTPAYNLHMSSVVELRYDAFPKEPIDSSTIVPDSWPLTPNEFAWATNLQEPVIVSDTNANRVRDGRLKVFVYVHARYRDIFGDLHNTGICSWWNNQDSSWTSADKYNYAD
jgi:hypothetical protein